MREIWVIGMGRFGLQALQYLSKKNRDTRFVLVDEAEANLVPVEGPNRRIEPRTWKTLIQPRVTRILEAWKSPKVLHICGATDMIIEMMNECGADALSVDIKNNLAESRKK